MALEGLGIAANVIAVVDLSVKVVGWCAQYAQDVKYAKDDKARLSQEVTRLNLASQNARDLLNGPQGERLTGSKALFLATADSESQLRRLEKLLATEQKPNKVSLDALKWPFRSKGIDAIVQDLRRCTDAISSALQVDQTSIILDIDQKTALDRLRVAEGASFDSHAEEHNPTCLPNTRVKLLNQISQWIDDPNAKPLFWLNGMAGTGKSTISRTVAWSRSRSGDLGGSFFFKRGETDRGNLAKFFPTLALQLAASVPALASHIKNAIDADSTILGKTVREQFDKLIIGPLSKIPQNSLSVSSLVIIVDALDECERGADISLLIDLFSHANSSQRPRLRIFITSRPELLIRLGFNTVQDTYQDLILHKIPAPIIEHDIKTFLHHELEKIRGNFNLSVEGERKLPSDWPGESKLQSLVMMAVPLFIFASTVCLFISDRRYGNPSKQLQEVLTHMGESHGSKLDMTYAPVLKQQLPRVSERKREEIIEEFCLIVGTIVTLASPLSALALSRLLDVRLDTVDDRLDMLHSVLSVPSTRSSPVRLLHSSFRDYLIDPENKGANEFWVDEESVHRNLATQCLRIMYGGLRKNICGIRNPGSSRFTIDSRQINKCLAPELQYACLYWVHHRAAVGLRPDDIQEMHDFLKRHLLHWLETMSLMRRTAESLVMLRMLQDLLKHGPDQNLSNFVADSIRFVLTNLLVIDETPLQIYSSGLMFAPMKSIVRETYESHIPRWISLWPHVEGNWDACLSTLEGHGDTICSVVFSHDSKFVASASSDKTVRIWSVETGQSALILEDHSGPVTSAVFSHDSKLIASASQDMTVRIWSLETGQSAQVLEGHSGPVTSAVFSHDSKLIASASQDRTVRIWSVETGQCEQVLEYHIRDVDLVVFSHDSKLVASVSWIEVQVWSVETGKCKKVMRGHDHWVNSVVFSHNSKLVASASFDKTIRIWSVETGKCERVLEGHGNSVTSVVFSHDSKHIASASWDRTVRIWSTKKGQCEQVLEGYSSGVDLAVFSHNSKLMASASSDEMRIWSLETGQCEQVLESHRGEIGSVVFSHNLKLAASTSFNHTVQIWSVEKGQCEQFPDGHGDSVTSVVFSHDSKFVASASLDETVRIWSVETGKCEQVLEGHSSEVDSVVFSNDSKLLASVSYDTTIRIWSMATGKCEQVLEGHNDPITPVVFSHDSKLLASVSHDTAIRIWSLETGECEQVLEGHTDGVSSMVFSHDSKLVASGSDDTTIRIWSMETGICEQVLEDHSSEVDSVVFSNDSKFVASASLDETVRIWCMKTGQCERVISLGLVAELLCFDTCDSSLITDAGVIPLGHGLTPSSACLSLPRSHLGSDLGTDDQSSWITWRGQNLVRLPVECRSGTTIVSGSDVVVGCRSGRLIFLSFSLDELQREIST